MIACTLAMAHPLKRFCRINRPELSELPKLEINNRIIRNIFLKPIMRNHYFPGTVMDKRIAAIVLAIFFILMQKPLFAGDEKPVEELSTLVATALADNPELKSSEARWQVFRNKVAQAGSLEDPMLTLAIRNGVISDPLNFGREPMTGKVVELSQKIPFWGKRDLQGEIAAKAAESYRWSLEERKLELTRMVKESWYRIYYIDKSMGIVDGNIRILDDFITLAETRYSVNKGSQTDILKAQPGTLKASGDADYPGTAAQERTGEPQHTCIPSGRHPGREGSRFCNHAHCRFRRRSARVGLRKPAHDQGPYGPDRKGRGRTEAGEEGILPRLQHLCGVHAAGPGDGERR